MEIKIALRNTLAALVRTTPNVRGKFRIGKVFQDRLTNYDRITECLVEVRMKEGSRMLLDLRTRTEAPVFWTGAYDSGDVAKILGLLAPGAQILDVGANIGFWSIQLGRRLRPGGGKVFSFEPMPANFRRLSENIAMNELQAVVHAFNVALGPSNGEIQMENCEGGAESTGNSVIVEAGAKGPSHASARMARLDDFAPELNIATCDFVKIDVEGGEFGFIQGGLSFLRRHQPVIHMELNYYWMGHFGWNLSKLKAMVEPLGYSIYRERGRRVELLTEAGTGIETALLIPSSAKGEKALRDLRSA